MALSKAKERDSGELGDGSLRSERFVGRVVSWLIACAVCALLAAYVALHWDAVSLIFGGFSPR